MLEHGLAALTLRPLAAALGTSDRMLLYHFGDKDALVDELVDAVNRRLQASLALSDRPAGPRAPAAAVLATWEQLSAPAAAPYLRFLAEVSALAVRDPARFAGAARAMLESWLALVAPMLASEGTPHGTSEGIPGGTSSAQQRALATAVIAALYALAVDVQLLGNRTASDEAVAALAALLDR